MLLTNSFEGITPSGTAITTGNSGGVSGNAFDVIAATPVSDSAQAMHGTLSMKCAAAGTGTGVEWTTQVGTVTTAWFRLYVFVTANPAAQTRICFFSPAAGTSGAVHISTTGHLLFTDSTGSTILTSTATVPLSAWFRVEGFITGSATTGQLEFKLFTAPDGTVPAETQTSTALQNTSGAIARVIYGPSNAVTYTEWIDDVGITDTGYLGPAVAAGGQAVLAARPGLSRLRHHHGARRQQQMQVFPAPAVADVTVTAGLAEGTGSALPPSAAVTVTAGLAAGSGEAPAALPADGVTGGLAGGAGSALNASAALAVTAGLAAGTGTAPQPSAAITAAAGLAAGSAEAPAQVPAISVTAGLASGSAEALAPAVSAVEAGIIAAQPSRPGLSRLRYHHGARRQQQMQVFPPLAISPDRTAAAEPAGGTAEALAASAAVTIASGPASGAGEAPQPVPAVAVQAGLAAGVGSALAPSLSETAAAGLATGSGTARQPSDAVTVSAGLASGTGSALAPAPAAGITSGLPAAAGLAMSPAPAVTITAGLPPGAGEARQASASTVSNVTVSAGLASGAGEAPSLAAALAVHAAFAAGTGAALPAGRGAGAGLASGAGTALPPASLAVAFTPGLASGSASALGPAVQGQVAVVKGYSTATSVSRPQGSVTGTGEAAGMSAGVSGKYGSAPGTGEAAGMTADVTAPGSSSSGVN